MHISFECLKFDISDGEVRLISAFGSAPCAAKEKKKFYSCAEVQVAGRNHDAACGAKHFMSSEWKTLRYVSHVLTEDRLVIVQENDILSVASVYEKRAGGAIASYTEVRNISAHPIVLEYVSSFFGMGLCANDEKDLFHTYLYRFHNSWYEECQPRRASLFECGLSPACFRSMNRISGCNVGSWSTKEELPQAILEFSDRCMMFQIESNNSWYWEVAENEGAVYLFTGGGNVTHTQWSKKLAPGEIYATVTTALTFGKSLDEVIARMTAYRRQITDRGVSDFHLPVVFNEYMHLSWDSPEEKRTASLIPSAAALGADIYVIDCGWHDEEDGNIIYPYVGKWKESKKRFPQGIKNTVDLIHAYGMKAGLWMEPEIIGYLCEEMSAYYPEDAFLRRNGERILVMGRYFLDFRHRAVRNYLNGVIDGLVEIGVDYLKFDYNEDCGPGTEVDAWSLGEGLEKCAAAFIDWLKGVRARHPGLIIEACASGGQRLDYKTLSCVSLASTSDQTKFYRYPFIAANIHAGVLPEQAAVWSYPVDSQIAPKGQPTEEWAEEHVSEETVIINMVNAILGRMHLASHIELLNEKKRSLIAEGVALSKKLSQAKREGFPCFPLGFADFSSNFAATGILHKNRMYLAVWNLKGENERKIPLADYGAISAKLLYPANRQTDYYFEEGNLTVSLGEREARLFLIGLKDEYF